MIEVDHEKQLKKAVDRAGGLCLKLPAIIYRGIPDRMVLLPGGRIFFIELKVRKGRASEVQLAFREILRRLGFNSELIHGKEGVERFINEQIGT